MSKRKPLGYWTYDRCFAEAKKYKLKADFKKNAAGAYDAAKDKGWLAEYTWLENRPLKWTYETCFEEAKKYKIRSDFSKGAGAAYRIALNNGWLNEYSWFEEVQKPGGYWNYDTCYEEAKKYKSRGEFALKSSTAYDHARRRQWLDKYSWFVSDAKPAGYWTYETCYDEAKKYKTRSEFSKQSGSAYNVARRNHWLDDYTWFEKKFTWTYEKCLEVAKRFNTKRDFQKGHPGAYSASIKYGWIKHFDWMIKARVNVISDNVDNVYLYFFDNYNAVYIGRTINTKRRDREHIFNTDSDAVAKFAVEHNCPVPPMVILEDCLSLEQGQEREDYWVNYYRDHGYYVLNKARTGIGIGALGNIAGVKWTKKRCYEEAKLYSYRKEFQRGSVGAYTQALKRGWLKDYTWFERPRNWNQKWDRDSCYEEALKYNKPSQFEDNSPGAYRAAKKNGWLVDYTWIEYTVKPASYWTYERCYEEAKKYKSRGELKNKVNTAYRTARTNGWIDDYTWFVKYWEPKWNKETCYEEAKKYKIRTEFHKNNGSAYAAALKKGWIKDYTWFVVKSNPMIYWTYERCVEESKKYKLRSDFRKGSPIAYRVAKRRNWIEEFSWLNISNVWTYQECYDLAHGYYYKKDFREAHPSAYRFSLKNGWISTFTWLKTNRHLYWTKERCFEMAKKCSTKKEFARKRKAYDTACENGWINNYDWLIDTITDDANRNRKWTKDACYEEAKRYTSKSAFEKSNGSAYSAASKNGWLKDYNWFEELKIPKSYWTYEKCYEEAQKCHTLKEFYRGYEKAYRVAKEKGWVKDYTWFVEPTHQIKWTYETCLEKAKTCHSKIEFETKFSGAMNVARRNNWLKDYTWFKRPTTMNSKWSYDSCKEESQRFNSRGAFAKGSKAAYLKAWKNGWLDDFFPKNE